MEDINDNQDNFSPRPITNPIHDSVYSSKLSSYKFLFYVIVSLLLISNSFLIYKNNLNIKTEKDNNAKTIQDLNQKISILKSPTQVQNPYKTILTDPKNYFDINYTGDDFCKIKDAPNENQKFLNQSTICAEIDPSHKIYPLFSKIRYGSIKELDINDFIYLLTPNYLNQSLADIKNIDYSELISGVGDPWYPIYTNKDIIVWGGGSCGTGFAPLEGTDPHFQETVDQCEGLRTKIENQL